MKRSNHVAKAGGDKWKSLTEESGGGGGSCAAAADKAEEEGEESDKSKSEVNDDEEEEFCRKSWSLWLLAKLVLPLPSTIKRTIMNGKKGSSIQINICLPPNTTPQSESMKKSTKAHNGKGTIPMRKLMMEVWEFAREGTDRVTFSLKVGLACLLVSLLILIQAPYQVFGTNFILEKVEFMEPGL
ncbi:hypothetical protein ZIOFF_010708 [Zingiber officinale]|uniref:Uncharacterized protein n=1 Tax=Zingiber officinale TaxID=94328 RepID=A0A8J5HQ02_ZINOF|nr:hypothetical protein ZIOFF_010708 [Zingiber officinale]